nr:MAG TPA: hypothetical protein [Inoviridae sp.]
MIPELGEALLHTVRCWKNSAGWPAALFVAVCKRKSLHLSNYFSRNLSTPHMGKFVSQL